MIATNARGGLSVVEGEVGLPGGGTWGEVDLLGGGTRPSVLSKEKSVYLVGVQGNQCCRRISLRKKEWRVPRETM